MRMTKKITLLILSALAAVCIICAAMLTFGFTASAEDSDDHGGHSRDDKWNELTSNSLSIEGGSGAKYYLGSDLNLLTNSSSSNITITSGVVTICLNGKTITGNSSGSVITVNEGATLTLCDCDGDGKITGGNAAKGGGVCVEAGGTFIMEGGTITGNTAFLGGGVYVETDVDLEGSKVGSFTMTGGAICQNKAIASSDRNGQGGGIYSDGEVSLEGGSVTENNAATSGGGIFCNSGTIVTKNNFILYTNTINSATGNTIYGSGMYVNISVASASFQGGFILDDVVSAFANILSIQGGYYRDGDVRTSSVNDSESTVFGKAVGDSYRVIYNNNLLADSDDPYFNTVSTDIQSQVSYFVYAVGQPKFVTDVKTYDGNAASTSDITVTVYMGDSIDETADYEITNFYTIDSSGSSYTVISAPTDAGVYYVYVQLSSNYTDYANQQYYTATGSYVPYTIEKASLSDETTDVSIEYDGYAHGAEIKFTGFVNGETLESLLSSNSVTIEYSQTGGTSATDWTSSPSFAITATNCADSPLTIYYRVTFTNYKPESDDSDAFYGSCTITINKASVTDLEAPVISVYCGKSLLAATCSVSGWELTYNGEDDTACWGNSYTFTAVYSLADSNTENYDWEAVADNAGMTYVDDGDSIYLSCTVSAVVTHSSSDYADGEPANIPTDCETPGNYEWNYCDYCGKYFDADGEEYENYGGWEIPAGHVYEFTIDSPTKSNVGSITVTCSRCSDINDKITLPALGNSVYEVVTDDATCTEAGSITYRYVDETYGEIDVATETIEALGHDYVKTVTYSPTETSQGYLEVTCSRCSDVSDSIVLYNLTDGDYTIGTIDPTCETEGSITYYYVHETYGEAAVAIEVLPALGHDVEDGYHEETEDTIEYWECATCLKYFVYDSDGQLVEVEDVTISHVAEIVVLCVGGAICVGLAAVLAWMILKKRRAE